MKYVCMYVYKVYEKYICAETRKLGARGKEEEEEMRWMYTRNVIRLGGRDIKDGKQDVGNGCGMLEAGARPLLSLSLKQRVFNQHLPCLRPRLDTICGTISSG